MGVALLVCVWSVACRVPTYFGGRVIYYALMTVCALLWEIKKLQGNSHVYDPLKVREPLELSSMQI